MDVVEFVDMPEGLSSVSLSFKNKISPNDIEQKVLVHENDYRLSSKAMVKVSDEDAYHHSVILSNDDHIKNIWTTNKIKSNGVLIHSLSSEFSKKCLLEAQFRANSSSSTSSSSSSGSSNISSDEDEPLTPPLGVFNINFDYNNSKDDAYVEDNIEETLDIFGFSSTPHSTEIKKTLQKDLNIKKENNPTIYDKKNDNKTLDVPKERKKRSLNFENKYAQLISFIEHPKDLIRKKYMSNNRNSSWFNQLFNQIRGPNLTGPLCFLLKKAKKSEANKTIAKKNQKVEDENLIKTSKEVTGIKRYSFTIERNMYSLSHTKLAEPNRPLGQQVAISNMMYWYLSIVKKKKINPNRTRGHQLSQYQTSYPSIIPSKKQKKSTHRYPTH